MQTEETENILQDEVYALQLYVSGMTQKSMEAIENINRICTKHPEVKITVEIIDIYKSPETAGAQHIIFCPSLVKQFPLPRKVLIGTLSDTVKVERALGISINA